MIRMLKWVTAVLFVALLAGATFVLVQLRSLEVERISDDLHMVKGIGGNVAVLKTGVGAIIVDTMTFTLQGSRIRHLAESLTGEQVVMVINTHYHGDHTHGNPGFTPGTQVLSTTRTLEHLNAFDAAYWTGDAAALLPNHTFEQDLEIRLGSKTVRLLHPGRGHTDGDLVALFVEDATLHAGDLFTNRVYPSVDLKAGGTVREWADTLGAVLALQFDHVIPGHGALSDRAGVEQFQRFMRQLWVVGADAKAKGLSLAETQRQANLTEDAGYQTTEIPMLVSLNRDSVVRAAWEEATGMKPQ